MNILFPILFHFIISSSIRICSCNSTTPSQNGDNINVDFNQDTFHIGRLNPKFNGILSKLCNFLKVKKTTTDDIHHFGTTLPRVRKVVVRFGDFVTELIVNRMVNKETIQKVMEEIANRQNHKEKLQSYVGNLNNETMGANFLRGIAGDLKKTLFDANSTYPELAYQTLDPSAATHFKANTTITIKLPF